MKGKEKLWKRYSIFQIVSVILIAILFVAIIVQVGIMIGLKNKIDDTKDKNDEITNPENDKSLVVRPWMQTYENQIISFNKRN